MKKIGMKAVVLAVLSMFITSGMVWAQQFNSMDMGTNYGLVKLGYFMPNDDEDGLEDFDSAFSFGAAFGHFFTPELSVEGGLEYYSTSREESASDVFYYGDEVTTSIDVSVIVIPVTAKYHIPLSDLLTGYVGGGIGIYMVDAEIEEELQLGSDSVSASVSDDDTCFGFHLVAGADYLVNPNLSVGAELKWSKADAEFEYEIDGETYSDDVNIGGITVSVVGKMLF